MKGLKTWVWMSCLCLGITQTVSKPDNTRSGFSSLTMKIINSTNSSSVSDLQRRNNVNSQLLKRIGSENNQHDKVTGDLKHETKSSTNLVITPNNATSVGKRSVKRGEVNYFENFTNQAIPTKSLQVRLENMSRHKRIANEPSKRVVENEPGRKQQIRKVVERHQKESAVRRKEIRDEKLVKIKNRRLQLKNYGKSPAKLHIRDRQSILERMRGNRVKIRRNNEPQRQLTAAKGNHRSTAQISLFSKRKSELQENRRQYSKNYCKKSIIEKKSSMNLQDQHCVLIRGNRINHIGKNHPSKGSVRKKSTGSEGKSRQSKSSYDIGNNSIEKKSTHFKNNLKEDKKSRDKDHNSKKEKIDNKRGKMKSTINHIKSRKTKQIDKGIAVSKSSALEKHEGMEKRKNKNKDRNKHTGKESKSKKHSKDRNGHQPRGPKNKKSGENMKNQKLEEDREEQDKENIVQGKDGKITKSETKISKKHIAVLSDNSEEKSNKGEASSRKHKQERGKHSQAKFKKLERLEKKDSGNMDSIKSTSIEKNAKHKIDHLVKKSKSTTLIKNSINNNKKLEGALEKNEGKNKEKGKRVGTSKKVSTTKESATLPGGEKKANEIEYLGHVLGFGLGNRKHPKSNSLAWTHRVHNRLMTGGYASSERLTHALSNRYGASASAGF